MEALRGNERQPGGDERRLELPHLFGRATELQQDTKDPCLHALRSVEQLLKSVASDMNAQFDKQEARHLDVVRSLKWQFQNMSADIKSRFDEQESLHQHAVSNSEKHLAANMQTHELHQQQQQQQLQLQRTVQQRRCDCEEDVKRQGSTETRDSRLTSRSMESKVSETKTGRLVRVVKTMSAQRPPRHSLHSNVSSDTTYERMCRYASARIAAAQDLEVLSSSESDCWARRCCLRRILQSNAYSVWMFLVAVANSILLGLQVETGPTSFDDQSWTGYDVADAVCISIFTCDVFLQVLCRGFVSYFWMSVDRHWNVLDATVAGCGALDILFTKMLAPQGLRIGHVTLLRVLRILRVLRTVRVLKILRFTQSLRSLIFSIATALKSVFWAIVMMVLMIYIFAVALTQATATFCHEHLLSDLGRASISLACHDAAYWSSIPTSMITLFQATSQGLNWGIAADALAEVGTFWYALFVVYIALMSLTVLNVITGFFCHNAIEAANYDSDIAAMMHVAKQEACTAALVTALRAEGEDLVRLSCMTLNTFEEKLQSPQVRAIMAFMGLESVDPLILFKLFDSDCKGYLDIEEFVAACMQLKGSAKAHQLAKLGYEQSHLKRSVEALRVSVDALAGDLLQRPSKRCENL